MKYGFWSLNFGLVLMILISLLPVGVFQAAASIRYGLWYARSEGFMQQGFLDTLGWLRIIGDTVLIIGALLITSQIALLIFKRNGDANLTS